MDVCAECGREIDPSGEGLKDDEHWMCETCYQKTTGHFGVNVVPLKRPVYKKITVSIEEHQAVWLEHHPRIKASHLLRDAIENLIS